MLDLLTEITNTVQPMTAMRWPNCGADLDDVPVGYPCPDCGGNRRSANVEAGAALVVVVAPAPNVEIGYNPDPGWAWQWEITQYQLRQLREHYRSKPPIDNRELGLAVSSLLIDMWHVADWLVTDNLGITWADIHSPLSPSLAICKAYANTAKHRKRDPGKPEARNLSYTSAGPTMSISHNVPGMIASPVDALDLAEQCERDWRMFLMKHGVPIPP